MHRWRIRVGFWSHRDNLYPQFLTCKKNVHIKKKERKWMRKRTRADAFLSVAFRWLFLLSSAVYIAVTREAARITQQPSLSRWQIIGRDSARVVSLTYSHIRARSSRVSAWLSLSLFHERVSDFFFALACYKRVHNCRWVSRAWSAAARLHIQMSVTRGRSCVGSRCHGGAR